MKTNNLKSFRINTYEKTGGGILAGTAPITSRTFYCFMFAGQVWEDKKPAWKRGMPLKSTWKRTSTVRPPLVIGWPVGPNNGP